MPKRILRSVAGFFIFLHGIWPLVTAGQSGGSISELLTQLRIARHDSVKADIHTALAELYWKEELKTERANDHARLALILAENLKDTPRQLLAYDKLIGIACELKGDIAEAMNYLKAAQNLDTTAFHPEHHALLMGREGSIFLKLEEYARSHELFLKQLALYEKIGNQRGIALTNYELGKLFYEQNEYEQALTNFKLALHYFEELKDLKNRMKTLNAIGQTKNALKDYKAGAAACSEALLLARALNNRFEIAKINANLGFAARHTGLIQEALHYYHAAFDIAEELDNQTLIGEIAIELGNTYHAINNNAKADVFYEIALKNANSTDSRQLKKNIYASLWPFYEKNGQKELAYECLKKLLIAKEEFYNEERTRSIINNQIRYETERREQEMKRLRESALENQLTIQKQRMENYVLFVVIFFALTVVVILYKAFRQKKFYNEQLEREVKKRTTELEASNASLQESNRLLEQSNAELERFAYIASHDLKSPLRNIISFLNLIERRLKPNQRENITEYLHFATENARQMHQLIQDVLEFSRVTGKDHPKSRVDLNDTLALVAQNLKEQMERSRAVIISNQLPVIEANSVHLLQLFQNLISNGLKYNRSAQVKVIVTHRIEDDKHLFAVRDNGIGIAPEYHEQIFEMFKRLHTKDEFSGTGIGLALCRKIVQYNGGRIWVESIENHGTTFYFTLPHTRFTPSQSSIA